MEEHLRRILSYVVEQAVETGEPVGSQHLVDRYGMEVSSATVRNYFMALEELGMIMQPHTSSGRLPSEQGYRFYVENILKPRPLSRKETNELTQSVAGLDNDVQRLKVCAKTAAELSQNAVVVGVGNMDSYYTGLTNLFSQQEFKDWNRVVSMSDVLDRLDEVLIRLRNARFELPTTLIGSACPFGPMCGTVMVNVGEGEILCVLGPMRMDYGQAISLTSKIQDVMKR